MITLVWFGTQTVCLHSLGGDRPTIRELAANVAITTVPDWETFFKWEKALLIVAFREDPELKQLATRIVEGAKTPQEKIFKFALIEKFVSTDYDDHGVPPRPSWWLANMVIARTRLFSLLRSQSSWA